jgi:Leucine-rich repeat (LRR) protein
MGLPEDNDYFSQISSLYLDDNKINGSGIRFIAFYTAQCKHLRLLSLKNCGLEDDSMVLLCNRSIKNMKHLNRLDLSSNMICDRSIADGFAMVYSGDNVNLTHLNMSKNQLSSEGAINLFASMSVNKQIKSVNLSDNNLDNTFTAWFA